MNEKKYRFYFHYNKPLSKLKNEHYWTVHYKKQCLTATEIQCNVITESKTNKLQPFVVMQGFAQSVEIIENKLIIV